MGCKSKSAGDWTALNSGGAKISCAKNCAAMKANCELSQEDIAQENSKKEAQRARDIDEQKENKANKSNYTWKHKHCKGLIIKPGIQGFQKHYEEMEKKLFNDIIDLKEDIVNGLVEKGAEVVKEKGSNYGIRTAARHGVALLGGPLVAVTEALASLVTIADTVYTVATIPLEIYNALETLEDELERLQKLKVTYSEDMSKLSRQIELQNKSNLSKKDKNAPKLTDKEQSEFKELKETHNKEFNDLADVMAKKADATPCIQAKRCQLIPYSEASKKSNKMNNPGGCCPGQTGHHLLPKAYFKDTCPGYNEDKAPCICVEGTNQGDGSHGEMHDEHDDKAEELIKSEALSYEDAIKAAQFAVNKTFKQGCRPKCLELQLDDYHKNLCGDTPIIKPVNKNNVLLEGAKMPETGNKRDDIEL